MTVDYTIHLNDFLTLALTGVVSLMGWGLRKAYLSALGFIDSVNHMDRRIEDTAEVVDIHTELLFREGWIKGDGPPMVSRRRRESDAPVNFLGRKV